MSEIKDRIISWATSEDFEVHIETPPKELPIEWIIRLTSKAPIQANVIVQQPRGKPDQIVASLGVVISEQHYRGLQSLKERDRAELAYEIIRDLTQLCPDCIVIIQPSITDFQRLLITRTLYTQDLTRTKLMTTIKTLVNALALLSLRLSTRFGPLPQAQRKPPSDQGFII